MEVRAGRGGIRRLNAWLSSVVPGTPSRRAAEEPSMRSQDQQQQEQQQHRMQRSSSVAAASSATSRGTAQRVANSEDDLVVSSNTTRHMDRQSRRSVKDNRQQRRRNYRTSSGLMPLQACEDLVLALLPGYQTTTPRRKSSIHTRQEIEPAHHESVHAAGRDSFDGMAVGGTSNLTALSSSKTTTPTSVSMASNRTTKDVAPKMGGARQRLKLIMRTGGGGGNAAARGVAMLRKDLSKRRSGRNQHSRGGGGGEGGGSVEVSQQELAGKEEWWLEEEVWKLLQEHEPSKVLEAKMLLEDNRHRLAELLTELRRKYQVPLAASSSKQRRGAKRKHAKNAPSCDVDDL